MAEIFSKVAQGIVEHPEKVTQVNAVYLFKISGPEGGIFHINLKDNPQVTFEEGPADCVLEIKDRDFIKLYKGVLPGYKAALTGKLKIKGELILATKLSEVFFAAKKEE
ncbi:MAG: hypothetical protein A2508_07030 [Candidatus Lambdaproteobacteria bacterium RIFOXYD12_FULL_49_8]|uniref:SCP2 domain-containing protein n=1 Tax=Candidatus Lambdaproteobacteria bacterium RIFOXYD2_FULL_50_16 TaxID=1817772 RepID=A0A1F6GG88_9PROT|nr:MAG: hypothetical protein A2508_07030 [Candidatus Lambdaproteobacteria bacterium RIFOXYD12_FULL_49_8]OGG97119.1 MAG: hypothetical protein A2527_13200 [Candidatus Lambdaproteobacteria bacterium RIFOXYD2_FULL_50_16]